MTLRLFLKSSVHLAIGSRLSLSTELGNTISSETVPGFIRKLYSAARVAGLVRDPLKSSPIKIGAKPALTPTAELLDEPDEFYKGFENSQNIE